MKVKNAGFLKIENESASLYCGVGGALLVCVINGEITQKDAKYMRGEEITTDVGGSGFCAVTYSGVCLGGGKISGGVVKNHYPKGLRIKG